MQVEKRSVPSGHQARVLQQLEKSMGRDEYECIENSLSHAKPTH